jgi:hypothetical protein
MSSYNCSASSSYCHRLRWYRHSPCYGGRLCCCAQHYALLVGPLSSSARSLSRPLQNARLLPFSGEYALVPPNKTQCAPHSGRNTGTPRSVGTMVSLQAAHQSRCPEYQLGVDWGSGITSTRISHHLLFHACLSGRASDDTTGGDAPGQCAPAHGWSIRRTPAHGTIDQGTRFGGCNWAGSAPCSNHAKRVSLVSDDLRTVCSRSMVCVGHAGDVGDADLLCGTGDQRTVARAPCA